MKLKDIPYFVKFIFSNESTGECFSTTDNEMLKFVVSPRNRQSITNLQIGQEIQFEPIEDNPKTHEITDIVIRHLFEDTDYHKYGIDLEDCTNSQGEEKEWLFSILIKLK